MLPATLKFIATLSLCIGFAHISMGQSTSPAAAAEDFAKAWNSHDARAFERLFTEDITWVPIAEVRAEGRSDLVKELAEIHATWAKSTTLTQSATKVQPVTPNVAVVFFHSLLSGQQDDEGKSMPAADRAMMLVTVKQADGWRIAAGQVTKPSPATK